MNAITSQTIVDLTEITRESYNDMKKLGVTEGKDCYILVAQGQKFLYIQEDDKFYCGMLMRPVDLSKFTGINVVKQRDIFRLYLDDLPLLTHDAKEEADSEV